MFDITNAKVRERVVLRKFEGDVQSGQEPEPVEAIVIIDGQITERWFKGDPRPCPSPTQEETT